MDKKIKVIWDFRGPAAEQTCNHYEIHLREYLKMHDLADLGAGVEHLSDVHSMAFLLIDPPYLEQIKQDLKPHRAEWTQSKDL